MGKVNTVSCLFEFDEDEFILDKFIKNGKVTNNYITDLDTGKTYCNIKTLKEREFDRGYFWVDIDINKLKLTIDENATEDEIYELVYNYIFESDLDINFDDDVLVEVELNDITSENYEKANSYKSDKIKKFNCKQISNEEFIVDLPKISELYESIIKNVKGQNEQVKKILTNIYKHYLDHIKSNMLFYGPAGVGKTEIMRQINKLLDIPFTVGNMTAVTSSGYYGQDVEGIFEALYSAENENINRVQNAIVFLDEIDKKAGNASNGTIHKKDVLDSLLKISEGGKVNLFNHSHMRDSVEVDTTNMLFIAAGAFSDLKDLNEKRVIGFSNQISETTLEKINVKDFIKYGLSPEFLGRFPNQVCFNKLTTEIYMEILKESDNSPLKIIGERLKLKDKNFEVPLEVYDAIISKINKEVGARELKGIVDELFDDLLYERYNYDNNIKTIFIDGVDQIADKLKLRYTIDTKPAKRVRKK